MDMKKTILLMALATLEQYYALQTELSALELTVAEVSRMAGFCEGYNLSRWFRRIYGLSPKQWQAECKKV